MQYLPRAMSNNTHYQDEQVLLFLDGLIWLFLARWIWLFLFKQNKKVRSSNLSGSIYQGLLPTIPFIKMSKLDFLAGWIWLFVAGWILLFSNSNRTKKSDQAIYQACSISQGPPTIHFIVYWGGWLSLYKYSSQFIERGDFFGTDFIAWRGKRFFVFTNVIGIKTSWDVGKASKC